MTRKLKALGLVLVGILVLVALAAASGWADGEEEEAEQPNEPKRFTTENDKAIVTGVQSEITTSFTTSKGETVCNEAHFAGTMNSKEESKLTITPSYTGECKSLGFSADVELNGCHYQFTLKPGRTGDNTPGAGTHTSGPVHILCPAGNSIIIKVTIEKTTFCTIKVPPQTPTAPEVDTKNFKPGTTKGEVLFTFTVQGVHYEVTGGFGACGQTGKTLTDGQIDSVMTVATYEDVGGAPGKQIGFRIYGDAAPK